MYTATTNTPATVTRAASPTKQRLLCLDLMRFAGILVIMLAHADPPRWLFQLRNFGTPLLIVASALTHAHIYAHRAMPVGSFLKRRCLRLVLPAWAFLTFLFVTFGVFSLIADTSYPFSLQAIFGSYMLYEGIGYVWIFRVYLFLALITPVGLWLVKAMPHKALYFTLLITAFAVYEAAMMLWHQPASMGQSPLDRLVLTNIPYALLFLYGLRLGELRQRTILIVTAVAFIAFAAMAWGKLQATGGLVFTQDYKYPPRFYYLSYALVATNVIYLACRHVVQHGMPQGVVQWLSSNSLWIYLWHIFALQCWRMVLPQPRGDLALCLAQMAFILGLGIIAAMAQQWLIRRFIEPQPRLSPVKTVLA